MSGESSSLTDSSNLSPAVVEWVSNLSPTLYYESSSRKKALVGLGLVLGLGVHAEVSQGSAGDPRAQPAEGSDGSHGESCGLEPSVGSGEMRVERPA